MILILGHVEVVAFKEEEETLQVWGNVDVFFFFDCQTYNKFIDTDQGPLEVHHFEFGVQ